MVRILIADGSDPEFSAALAKVLTLKGFGTVEAVCGGPDELWRRIVAEPPNLLLIDKKNGAEIIGKLRNSVRGQGVRVLVIDGDREIARALPGADGYIQSPAPPNTYVQAVRDILSA